MNSSGIPCAGHWRILHVQPSPCVYSVFCVVRLVRNALLATGPDSSFGEVHGGSCSGNIHMEDEVKDQEDEVEDGRDK